MPDADDRVAATLAEIRKAEQAATPGEWRHRTAQTRGDWTSGSKVMPIERVEADARPAGIGIFDAQVDAEFIATARTAIPRLLAAVEDALKLAGKWDVDAWRFDTEAYEICARALRGAITGALGGTQPGKDEDHDRTA